MANSNRTAVDVDDCRIPSHVFIDRAGLRSKGFVGFDQIQIRHRPAGFFQCFAAGIDRSNAHNCWVKPNTGIRGDARQRFDPAFFCFIRAHQQCASSAIVDAGCIGRCHASIFNKCRSQFLHVFDGCSVPDIFILIHYDIAFSGLNGEGCDFIREPTGFLRRFCFILRTDGKLILHIAANLPLLRNILCGLTHVIAVKSIPQTVLNHAVNILKIAHFMAGSQMRNMR